MPFKMKGTAMYEKVNTGKGTTMKLKKEFGGPMEMKSPMDMGHSPKKMKSPMDKALVGDQDKLPPKLQQAIKDSPEKMKTPMELEKEDSAMDMRSPMDLSPKKLTQDAAMKLTSEIKKSGMPLKEEDDSPMDFGITGMVKSMSDKPMGLGQMVMRSATRGMKRRR